MATVIGGSDPYTYQFSSKIGSTETPIPSSNVSGNIATIALSKAGTYTFFVIATDSNNIQSKKFTLSNFKVVDPVSVKTLSIDKKSPINIGNSIKLKATGQNGKSPYQYQFYYKLNNDDPFPIGKLSTTSSCSFTPPSAGTYVFYVEIKDSSGKVSDQKSSDPFIISNNPTIKKITASLPSNQILGTPINISAEATGGTGSYTYQFFYKNGKSAEIKIPDSNITGNSALFTPTESGVYTISVIALDSAGNPSNKLDLKNYKISPGVTAKNISIDKKSPQSLGTTLKLNAAGTGGKSPYQYQFYYKLNDGKPIPIESFSKKTSLNFNPPIPGTYTFYIEVKDSTGQISAQKSSSPFTISNNFSILKFYPNLVSGQPINKPIILTTDIKGGSGNYTCKFSYKIGEGPEKPIPVSSVNKNVATFTPEEAGSYTFFVKVYDTLKNPPEVATIPNYNVVSKPIIGSLSVSKFSPQMVDSLLSLQANGISGGTEPFQYQFYYQINDGTIKAIDKPTTKSSVNYIPTSPGNYTFYVELTDNNQTKSNRCSLSSYVINSPTAASTGKVVISNESTDIQSTESTGTLNAEFENMSTEADPELEPEAYEINPMPPFEFDKEALLPEQPEGLASMAAPSINSTKQFHVYNFVTKSRSNTVTAKLAYVGKHAQVWVESRQSATVITNDMAKNIGQEFDDHIYNLVRDNFDKESDINGDGKIAILYYDIQDGYSNTSKTFTYGGYFSGNDYENTTESNKMEVLYVDTWPCLGFDKNSPDITRSYSTITHEFQHLVNYSASVYKNNNDLFYQMSSWLNEGLSQAAEHQYEGTQTSRIAYYNVSTDIRDGQSVLDWKQNSASYSLSYLFVQYLRTQVEASPTGKDAKIFHEIIADPASAKEAVTHIIQKYIDPDMTLGEFMTNFRIALLLRESSGKYGFNGETGFNTIKTPLYTGPTKDLTGGGAIVKSVPLPFTIPANKGTNIDYFTAY